MQSPTDDHTTITDAVAGSSAASRTRKMTFAIVTPTLNAESYLEEALRSIWDQVSDRIEVDHVLVDGGSTDRTVEIARGFPTRIVSSTDDRGMYDAVNRGLAVARGDIVGYLNADDEIPPGALDLVATAFAEHPDAQWLFGKREFIDGDGRAFAWMQPVPFTLRQYLGLGWSCVPQETVWMRRSFFERLGPFDISFKNTGDYDMYARARREAEPLILRATLGRFRLHGEQLSFSSDVMVRESRRVQEKNGTIDRAGWLWGRSLSLRLNLRNPAWLLAKKTGKIRFSTG